MFLFVIYLLKLKRAYKKYGNSVLFQQDGSQLDLQKLISSARKNVPYFKENLPAIENNENLTGTFSELDFVTQKSQIKKKLYTPFYWYTGLCFQGD